MKILLGLMLIVSIHELGHLIAARWFRVPVQKCYVFFNPWYSVFTFRTRRTEYGIGWLPLGGYTKFREDSTPIFKRILIYSAGVAVNIIFGLSILGTRSFEMIGQYLYCITHGEMIMLSGYGFWDLCAFFSLVLGLVNLLPIGSLDGRRIYETAKQFYNLRHIYREYEKHKAGRK